MEGICHFWVVPADTAATSFWPYQYVIPSGSTPRAAVSLVTSPAYSLAGFRQQSPSCFARLRSRMNNSTSGSVERPESSQTSDNQGIAWQVRMYCFRPGNCGTFMPLSGVRGVFRIAVVWTRFVAAISAILSTHFNVLFTHAVVRLAVDCE